ncbi:MAG: hypothetical protein HY724_02980 [Candidatus Rokubacteria bacterium]|nr:hypothetical protein [Candidatus Rokubacteria bacterium]
MTLPTGTCLAPGRSWRRGAPSWLHATSRGSTSTPLPWRCADRLRSSTGLTPSLQGVSTGASCRSFPGEDLVEPVRLGVVSWEQVQELGEIVAGKAPGRSILFESQGLAMEDVAVGARVLERARAQGVGHQFAFGE